MQIDGYEKDGQFKSHQLAIQDSIKIQEARKRGSHFLLAFGYEVRCGDVSIPGDGYGYQIALRGWSECQRGGTGR